MAPLRDSTLSPVLLIAYAAIAALLAIAPSIDRAV